MFVARWVPIEAWSNASGLPKNVLDFAAMGSISIGLATLSWYLVEAKILALKDRFPHA